MNREKKQLKIWLLQNNNLHFYTAQRKFWLSLCFCFYLFGKGQIANYVTNGSFEDLKPGAVYPSFFSSPPPLVGWSSIDSNQCGTSVAHTVFGNVPLKSPCDYQWPRTGNGFVMNSIFIQGYPNNRSYWRNRLRAQLTAGAGYCIRYYVNVRNCSPYGVDTYGVFFGDNTLDTITQPYSAKIYLTPQINNPPGNFVTDTLGWTALTGSFTATGNEKYLVIGDFKSDANSTYTAIVQPPQNFVWCDINIDDVSLIPVNLPAYAGPDQSCIPGDSVFIGRQPDFATDSGCVWYKFPNMATPIATISGLWVKPVVTTTYIVRQQLECSSLKWDTVIVYQTAVGLAELIMKSEALIISPNPANDVLNVSFNMDGLDKEFTKAEIINSIGQLLTEIELNYNNKQAAINLKELPNGVYLLNLKGINSQTVSKRFVVAR